MKVTGPTPGWPKEPEEIKPLGGKEGHYSQTLSFNELSKEISPILDKLSQCVTVLTQRTGPEDFRLFYKVEQNPLQECLKKLKELQESEPKKLDFAQSLHVDEAIKFLRLASDIPDGTDPEALDNINKAQRELDSCIKPK